MPPSPSTLSCLGIVDDDEFINVDEADEAVARRVLLQALVVGVALWESTFIQSDSLSSMALGGIPLLSHPGRTSSPLVLSPPSTCAVLLKRSSFEENPALNFLWWPSNWV